MNLPSLQLLVSQYLLRSTYEKPHRAINVLYVMFSAFGINCENQDLIWLKWHKFPSIINIINSKMNRIVGGKLVRPAISCRVCVWPATWERVPISGLQSALVSFYFEKTRNLRRKVIQETSEINHKTFFIAKDLHWAAIRLLSRAVHRQSSYLKKQTKN